VDGAIRGLGQGPDDGLIAAEEGFDLGREGDAAFAAQREAVEASTNEIRIRIQFPGGGAAGKGGGGERRAQSGGTCEAAHGECHSFTSTWTVLEPVTAMSPMSISISAILELRVCVIPAELDCEPARINETEAGGSGRSAPSSWNAGSARHTRTEALVFGCRLLTVASSWPGVRAVAVSTWRKSAMLAVLASATVKYSMPGSDANTADRKSTRLNSSH